MEIKVGDIVETAYTNITNKIGKVVAVYENCVVIGNTLSEDSAHKKDRVRIIKSE